MAEEKNLKIQQVYPIELYRSTKTENAFDYEAVDGQKVLDDSVSHKLPIISNMELQNMSTGTHIVNSQRVPEDSNMELQETSTDVNDVIPCDHEIVNSQRLLSETSKENIIQLPETSTGYILSDDAKMNVGSECHQILQLCETQFPKHIQILQDTLQSTTDMSGEELKAVLFYVFDKIIRETLQLNSSITEICNKALKKEQVTPPPLSDFSELNVINNESQPIHNKNCQPGALTINLKGRLKKNKSTNPMNNKVKKTGRGRPRKEQNIGVQRNNVYIDNVLEDDEIENDDCDDEDFTIEKHKEELSFRKNKKKKKGPTPSLYFCKVCHMSFKIQNRYAVHMKSHKQGGKFACDICNETFISSYRLKVHQRIHNLNKEFICDVCGKSLMNQSALKNHMLEHDSQSIFQCSVCQINFDTDTNLKYHDDRCHSDRPKPYKCSECDKEYKHYRSYQKHKLTHGNDNELVKSEIKKEVESPDPISEMKPTSSGSRSGKVFACHICHRTYGYNQTLQDHIRAHNNERPFMCDTCGKSFSSSRYLYVHKRIHSGIKPFVCPYCNKGHSTKGQMLRHITTHTGERKYLCTICGKRFGHRNTLKNHVRAHSNDRPFPCKDHCGMYFKCKDQVNRHMLVHTKEQKFSCNVCGKLFGQNYNLRVHMRIHSGAKPYPCTRCGQSFTYNQTLKQHLTQCLKFFV